MANNFEIRFYNIHSKDELLNPEWNELVYVLNNFKLINFEGLTNLISELLIDCDVFETDLSLKQDYEIAEKKLYWK